MNEDILIPAMFFVTVIVCVIGWPLVQAVKRRAERASSLSPDAAEQNARLTRIEAAIESVAIEVERISEGQRFTTKLLSDRVGAALAPGSEGSAARREEPRAP